MNKSDSIIKITNAYLKAQKEIGAAVKDSNNSFFQSKYADLGAVMEACKKALNDNGISVLQPVNKDVVETILIHESGEWFSSETKIETKLTNTTTTDPKTGATKYTEVLADPQAYGSAITYARRYGLQSMVFIPAEDDDGNKASGNATKVEHVQKPQIVNRCSHCFATGSYHKPGCPNATPKSVVEDQLGGK